MAWIESHTVLRRHRKVRELAKELRLRPVYTIGHLHVLWHAALEQQENGDLTEWSDDFIADQADYPGNAPQFVLLLQKHGWLDGRILHDWLDYAGLFLTRKYSTSNRQKLMAIWAKHGRVYGDANPKRASSEQSLLAPNQPNQPTPPDRGGGMEQSEAQHFAQLWLQANFPNYNRRFGEFAGLLVQLGKPDAIRRVQEAVAAGKTANPFAYVTACIVTQQARETVAENAAKPVSGWQEGVLPDGQKPKLTRPPKAVG
jgi:hypothetical protein